MIAADLFAGLGGQTEGAEQAGCRVVWAGNHWRSACDIFEANHGLKPACQDLHQANWSLVPKMELLLASPACTGHTPARGKDRPHHDAARSTAWAVVSALECHLPYAFEAENVPAFLRWALFPAWCAAINALGYAINVYQSDAADHGVPQHRVRVFIVGTRSKHPIELRLPKREHVPAARFIDFSAGRWSPIHKPGRSLATLRRVEDGRRRFGQRFLAPFYGSGSGTTGRSLDRPIGTITTRDRWAVIDGDRMRMLLPQEARAAFGFRASYVLPGDPKLAMFMLGNCVAPAQACDYIRAIKEAV
jgi:DNA (cytosine-5)-methyltransferase 1